MPASSTRTARRSSRATIQGSRMCRGRARQPGQGRRSPAMTTRHHSMLAARGESLAAFDGRCIPAGGVAPRSNTPGILGRRALPSGRLARLGATPDFHHGLLAALLVIAGLTAGGRAQTPDRTPLAPSPIGWKQAAYIKASNPGEGHEFGSAVALSGDGNTL